MRVHLAIAWERLLAVTMHQGQHWRSEKILERGLQRLQSASGNLVWTDMAPEQHEPLFFDLGSIAVGLRRRCAKPHTVSKHLGFQANLSKVLRRWAVATLWGVLSVGSVSAQTSPVPSTGQAPIAGGRQSAAAPSNALFVTDEWHNLTRKDGTGLYLDVVRAVFARQGVKVEYRVVPYARAVQQVKDREADGWVASFMKEKKFPLYPQFHFDKNEQTIVFLKAKQKGPVNTTVLKNQRVAWLRDFGLDRFIQEPMRVTELDSIASAFKMLSSDRIDYFVGAKSDIEDYIKHSRQNMSEYGMAYALHLGLYMAFADTPRGAQLRDMWDAEMETFHKTDAFKAIYKKYGYPYPFP